jgi:uncharacterized protein (TIGR02246 family)
VTEATTPSGVVREIEALWRRGDLEGMMSHVAQDAQFVNATGVCWRGQAAIRDGWRQILQLGPIAAENEIVAEQLVTPEVAIVTNAGNVAPTRLPNGRVIPASRTAGTFVLKRDQDRWLVVAGHSSVFLAPS